MRDVVGMTRLTAAAIVGLFIGALFIGMATPTIATQPTSWSTMPSMGGNRSEAAVTAGPDGLIYVMGGFSELAVTPLDTANTYNPLTGEWKTLAPMPVATRGAAAVSDGEGKIYVLGGDDGTPIAATQIYDIASNTWSTGADMPGPRWELNAVYVNSYVYVVGGYSAGAQSTVWYYTPSTDTWNVRPSLPSGRFAGALLVTGSDLYYIGGLSGTTTAQDEVYHFDIYASSAWVSTTPLPAPRAAMAGVTGPDGLMYVFGGGSNWNNFGTAVNTGYWFNPSNATWMSIPNLPIPVRYEGAAATNDGRIWCLGGSNETTVFAGVFSLRVADYQITLTPSSVGQGQQLLVTVTPDFAYVTPLSYYTFAYAVGPDDVVYGVTSPGGMGPGFMLPVGNPFAIQIPIPQSAPNGTYTFVLLYLEFQTSTSGGELGGKNVTFTVTDAPSTQEQIDTLHAQITQLQSMVGANDTVMLAQIAALQSQANSLRSQLNSTQSELDTVKSNMLDSTTGIVILALVVVSIILMVVVLVLVLRKK